MKTNKRTAQLLFYAVGLLILTSPIIFAQQAPGLSDKPTKPCAGEKFVMPPTISIGSEAFENYLRVAALPAKERRPAFAALSNDQKASLVRVRYALQLIKNPDFSKEQRDFILEAVLKITADLYDSNDPLKALLSEKLTPVTWLRPVDPSIPGIASVYVLPLILT